MGDETILINKNDEVVMKYINAKKRIRQINLELFLTSAEGKEALLKEKSELVKFVKQNWGKIKIVDR